MKQLPQFAADMLASCPTSGEGVHSWLFRTARVLHAYRPEGEITALLEAASHNCGRLVPAREINSAVHDSRNCAYQPGQKAPRNRKQGKWPDRNRQAVEDICANAPGVADLWEASPVRLEEGRQHTEEVVDQLFPGNPWLCVGESSSRFDTRHREDWRGSLHRMQLIVPSPMTDKTGTAKGGHASAHTLDNTGPRWFLVLEFDEGDFDQHAAILMHLSTKAPFVLAVMSGNKSLHGWFNVRQTPKSLQHRFMRYAVSLGADNATWSRCQFVRMPDGLRTNGNRQSAIYFNPNNI